MKTPAVPLKLRLITATLEPQQVLCPYAAVTGRFYLRLRFLPSGSGATAGGLFPRLAPTAVSLKADNPLPSPSRPLSGVYALPRCLSTVSVVFCSYRLIPARPAPAIHFFHGSPVRVAVRVVLLRDTGQSSCPRTVRSRPAAPRPCRRHPPPGDPAVPSGSSGFSALGREILRQGAQFHAFADGVSRSHPAGRTARSSLSPRLPAGLPRPSRWPSPDSPLPSGFPHLPTFRRPGQCSRAFPGKAPAARCVTYTVYPFSSAAQASPP